MKISKPDRQHLNYNIDEQLFRLLVASIKDYAIFMLDPGGHILTWNQGAERIKGYREEEITGRHISVFYTPDDIEINEPQHNLSEALKNGSFESEGWRVRKDGSLFWANVVFTPLYNDGKQLTGFAKITRDMTRRKKTEDEKAEINTELERRVKENTEKILENELRFRKLIENSHDGITLMNKDLKVVYRSRSAERISGWNNLERDEYEITGLIHPDDEAPVATLLKEVLASPGKPTISTYRTKHKLGHYIWVECLFTNRLDDKNIHAIVCNFRDVTEKIQADALLQNTVKELSAYKYALDESAIVAITDQKGTITHVNQNFCNIAKYSAAELLGQDHRIINSSWHDKAFIRGLWKTIAGGKIWRGELKNKAKDGSFYWVDTTIVPFLNEKGKPYQYIAIRSDITESKISQEKIIESEHFIKTITDNIPALIVYWTADMRCLFANKACLDYLGKPYHEVVGLSRAALRSEDVAGDDTFSMHIEKVLQGHAQVFENQVTRRNGEILVFQFHYLPDWEGEVVKGYFSLAYDITELKLAQKEISKKTEQIESLLENITDGFIAIDENMCYTYANKQIGKIVGREPSSLIGRNIWEIFPDAVGSATYQALHTALNEKKYVCNEDYYEPLKLWQENRAYPASDGVSMFIRDITKSKQEEQHLKLLESVITNTTDAILVTEAFPLDEPGPRIVYVNEAFTNMTGYAAEEVIGKTPRILQGPKSNGEELKKLSETLRRQETCEVTTINYKKNGEEFWINFSVSPVMDKQGKCTHFIAVERDITGRKNEELHQSLLAEISLIFNEDAGLDETLYKVLERLVDFGDFSMAEAWLIGSDRKKISLISKFPKTDKMKAFYEESGDVKSFSKGEGLPGIAWQMREIQFWDHIGEKEIFLRKKAAKKAGLHAAYGFPLQYNKEIIGVLVLGLNTNKKQENGFTGLFRNFSIHFGAEIRRKQLAQELNQLFHFAPDILCVASTDGYFRKINPAMSSLLEYTTDELLTRPFIDFVYAEDKETTENQFKKVIGGSATFYFEDRFMTRSGKIKWLAWTTTPASEEGLIFCVAKDITERKVSEIRLVELNEDLRKHAKELAISNAELEQFAYVASHDLQEPLRMVTSFLTQLEKKYNDTIDEKGRQYIHFAVDGAKRMRQIILDLLEFSRVGRTEENMEEVELQKIIQDILALYRKQIEEQSAAVTFDHLPVLQTYKVPLRQVFQNLIGNSLKYQKAGTPARVTITGKELQEHWQFSVKDNGIGIDPEYFDKIFIIFQRLHNKDEYSGTGMGLAVTKKIVENLGGRIWVESGEGEGSTFYFTILKNKRS